MKKEDRMIDRSEALGLTACGTGTVALDGGDDDHLNLAARETEFLGVMGRTAETHLDR